MIILCGVCVTVHILLLGVSTVDHIESEDTGFFSLCWVLE